MIRSMLVYLGLRKAPVPVRNYLAASSMFGAVPVAAFFAWKYRDDIQGAFRKYSRMPTTSSAV